jgi:hypothetical protein
VKMVSCDNSSNEEKVASTTTVFGWNLCLMQLLRQNSTGLTFQ